MHKGMVADGRSTAQGVMRIVVAVLLVTLLGGGAWTWSAWREGAPVVREPAAPAVAPRHVVEEDANDAAAMSPQALAQYRAFYAEQMASEAALEQWAQPRADKAKNRTAQQSFYAEQMASEAALEGWSRPVRGLPSSQAEQPPRQVVDGVQFE